MVKDNPNGWYDSAYRGNPFVEVEYNITIGKSELIPGVPIKFKNVRGTFKYRCLARNLDNGKEWIECLDAGGAYRAFYIGRFKQIVKPPKKRLKRKAK